MITQKRVSKKKPLCLCCLIFRLRKRLKNNVSRHEIFERKYWYEISHMHGYTLQKMCGNFRLTQ